MLKGEERPSSTAPGPWQERAKMKIGVGDDPRK
jgi:hypothetical protein